MPSEATASNYGLNTSLDIEATAVGKNVHLRSVAARCKDIA
jgi:hypothetical protein